MEGITKQNKLGHRLLLFPAPFHGHLNPMLQLATLLHSKGFSITIIQTPYNPIEPTRFPYFTYCSFHNSLLELYSKTPPPDSFVVISVMDNCSEPFQDCLSQILSEAAAAADKEPIPWHNTQEPKSVLYVSFGSIAAVSKADFLEIAYGLANSKHPFLLVICNGLIEGSEENAPPKLPEGYIDMVGQRAHIIEWAPQQKVLHHPAVGGFWTHCGWNSIMESISEGVPMLCQTCFADQTMNMRHVSDSWKIGLQLEKRMNRREIERAIRKLMVGEEGEAMRKRITTLKEKATLSFMENGSSYESLKNLTSYLLSF